MKYPINSPSLRISQALASGSPEVISTTACCSASVITCPNAEYDRQTNSRSCAPREASTRTKLRTGVHDIIWCFRGDRTALSNQGQFVRKEIVAVALCLLENAECERGLVHLALEVRFVSKLLGALWDRTTGLAYAYADPADVFDQVAVCRGC